MVKKGACDAGFKTIRYADAMKSEIKSQNYIDTVSEPCGVAMEPQTPCVEAPVHW